MKANSNKVKYCALKGETLNMDRQLLVVMCSFGKSLNMCNHKMDWEDFIAFEIDNWASLIEWINEANEQLRRHRKVNIEQNTLLFLHSRGIVFLNSGRADEPAVVSGNMESESVERQGLSEKLEEYVSREAMLGQLKRRMNIVNDLMNDYVHLQEVK